MFMEFIKLIGDKRQLKKEYENVDIQENNFNKEFFMKQIDLSFLVDNTLYFLCYHA